MISKFFVNREGEDFLKKKSYGRAKINDNVENWKSIRSLGPEKKKYAKLDAIDNTVV